MSVELVEVVRSGFRESVHHGSLVVVAAGGDPVLEVGSVHTPMFPRSCNKPLQAVALLRNGFDPVDDAELAISAASHSGERRHVELVRRLLDRFGLAEDALRCPADLPGNETARAEVLTHGARARRIYMNCSGKHAAMVATCTINDWPTESYLDAGHPLQQSITETIGDLSGEPENELGIDGCGLPIVPVSLVNLARAYATLVTGAAGTPERRVADAVRADPFLVSGSDTDDLRLMSAVPGLLCKAGAEGVHVGALPDGRAFALKIADGHERARLPLTAAVLTRMGVDWREDPTELAARPVLGGDGRVGVIRAVPGALTGRPHGVEA